MTAQPTPAAGLGYPLPRLDPLDVPPGLASAAVEGLLRFHTIAQTGLCRVATVDVEVGQLIRSGEGVIVSVESANRDPAAFPDPGTLRLDRGSRRQRRL